MATLTIRNLDEVVKRKLRLQAAAHGCSMEAEARAVLSQSVMSVSPQLGLAQRINNRFKAFGVDSLPIPDRQSARITTLLDE